MDGTRCTRNVIAAGDYALVEQCSCGSVHVTIGAVTLRLTGSVLPALAATLGDAARALVLRGALASSAGLGGAVS